ncbi:Thioredoxin [Candidatus Hodgkinia cicadicola]|nr:Thioredoxin [Candidatus Hodgkinia cicadicola]
MLWKSFIRGRVLRSLKRVLESKVSSLTLIWSSWCRVCVNSISLVLNALPSASELKLKLLSFDSNYRDLIKFGIKHLPIMFLFQDGRPMGVKVGALTAHALSEWLLSKMEQLV